MLTGTVDKMSSPRRKRRVNTTCSVETTKCSGRTHSSGRDFSLVFTTLSGSPVYVTKDNASPSARGKRMSLRSSRTRRPNVSLTGEATFSSWAGNSVGVSLGQTCPSGGAWSSSSYREFSNSSEIHRELRVWSFLKEKNADLTYLVKYFGATCRYELHDDGRGCFRSYPLAVMELSQGSLERLCSDPSLVTSSRTLYEWVGAVLSAVSTLHQVGVSHNAICPRSFMLCDTPDGGLVPKLWDFSCASLLPDAEVSEILRRRNPTTYPFTHPDLAYVHPIPRSLADSFATLATSTDSTLSDSPRAGTSNAPAKCVRPPEWPSGSAPHTHVLVAIDTSTTHAPAPRSVSPIATTATVKVAADRLKMRKARQGPAEVPAEMLTRASDVYMTGSVIRVLVTGRLDGDLILQRRFVPGFNVHEAADMVAQMQQRNPAHRIPISLCLSHPLFWDQRVRRAFLHMACHYGTYLVKKFKRKIPLNTTFHNKSMLLSASFLRKSRPDSPSNANGGGAGMATVEEIKGFLEAKQEEKDMALAAWLTSAPSKDDPDSWEGHVPDWFRTVREATRNPALSYRTHRLDHLTFFCDVCRVLQPPYNAKLSVVDNKQTCEERIVDFVDSFCSKRFPSLLIEIMNAILQNREGFLKWAAMVVRSEQVLVATDSTPFSNIQIVIQSAPPTTAATTGAEDKLAATGGSWIGKMDKNSTVATNTQIIKYIQAAWPAWKNLTTSTTTPSAPTLASLGKGPSVSRGTHEKTQGGALLAEFMAEDGLTLQIPEQDFAASVPSPIGNQIENDDEEDDKVQNGQKAGEKKAKAKKKVAVGAESGTRDAVGNPVHVIRRRRRFTYA